MFLFFWGDVYGEGNTTKVRGFASVSNMANNRLYKISLCALSVYIYIYVFSSLNNKSN